MVLTEVKQDLFMVDDDFALANCISSDYEMNAGISVKFTEIGVKALLLQCYTSHKWNGHGYCLPVKTERRLVYNLVTKSLHDDTPTYAALKESLEDLRDYTIKHNTYKLAMPVISCEFGELDYSRVKDIIKEVFGNTGIELKICKS